MGYIAIQTIGIIGCIVGILAYQLNEHKKIVLSKALTDVLYAVQYLLLGAYTGAIINCIGIARNLSLAKMKKGSRAQIPVTIFFVLLILAACVFTWTGPICILAMLGKTCTTISFSIKNTKILRLLTIPSCILWFVYDMATGSYGGAVYEIFGIASIIIAYNRLDRPHAEKKQRAVKVRLAKAHS